MGWGEEVEEKSEMQLEKGKIVQSSGLQKEFGFSSKAIGNAQIFLFFTKISRDVKYDLIYNLKFSGMGH